MSRYWCAIVGVVAALKWITRSATVGPPANLAASGRGTGSSPALMRTMISATRWRACSAPSTGLAPDGQAEADSIAVDRSGHHAMGSARRLNAASSSCVSCGGGTGIIFTSGSDEVARSWEQDGFSICPLAVWSGHNLPATYLPAPILIHLFIAHENSSSRGF